MLVWKTDLPEDAPMFYIAGFIAGAAFVAGLRCYFATIGYKIRAEDGGADRALYMAGQSIATGLLWLTSVVGIFVYTYGEHLWSLPTR